MVQIVENWAEVEGRIESVERAAPVAGHALVRIKVERVSAVKGFPNLLADRAGTELDVLVRDETLPKLDLGPGQRFEARVRRAGLHKVYAHPDFITTGPG
jgi:hypothetical protein